MQHTKFCQLLNTKVQR